VNSRSDRLTSANLRAAKWPDRLGLTIVQLPSACHVATFATSSVVQFYNTAAIRHKKHVISFEQNDALPPACSSSFSSTSSMKWSTNRNRYKKMCAKCGINIAQRDTFTEFSFRFSCYNRLFQKLFHILQRTL